MTRDYEPWLFQAMLDELTNNELGIGFVYSLLELVAKRYSLSDVTVTLFHEMTGVQSFRLGQKNVDLDVFAQQGSLVGVICNPDVVPESERDAIRTACQLSLSLHLARYSSARDHLTNIANRRSFDSTLETAAARSSRYGWPFTLVLADLNDFKAVNDRLGHARGDDLLRRFGFALRSSVRKGDAAARIGGDEFAVILSNAEGHEVTGFLDRLRSNLASAGNVIEFSVGTASSPRDSVDPAELFRIADARLYAKKGISLE
ncbi:MAG TPA: GGDEF domain-containing protein [Acidimicrobiales bacterium]